eukprot:scaffold55526_cov18-Tisochrysis_lutea.AAC.1
MFGTKVDEWISPRCAERSCGELPKQTMISFSTLAPAATERLGGLINGNSGAWSIGGHSGAAWSVQPPKQLGALTSGNKGASAAS